MQFVSPMMNGCKPGDVFRMTWDDSLRWVLAADDVQVMYDTWDEKEECWTLRSTAPRELLYKSFHRNFLALATRVGFDALTDDEISKFGLSLPMILCQHRDIAWTSVLYSTMDQLASFFHQTGVSLSDQIVLPIPAAVLIPYDSVKGMQTGIIAHAHQGGFSEKELLWHAHRAQQQVTHKIREGIGIHRQGWQQGLPSFYIGGYYDLGDYRRMHEELFVSG